MAKIIWASPAVDELLDIAEYIALENPDAAGQLIRRVYASVESLRKFPKMGSRPKEMLGLPYCQLVLLPCRVFYRIEKEIIYIVHVYRCEQLFREEDFQE